MTPIRPIAEDGIAACVAIGVEALRPVFGSFHQEYGDDLFARIHPDWESTQASHIETACSAESSDTWVAVVDGEIGGFVTTTTDDTTGLGDIGFIAVSPRQQRRGIGGKLIRRALDKMGDVGMASATAYTRDHPGHTPVRRALEKAGFVPMGIQPRTLIVELAASPAAPTEPDSRIRPIASGEASDCVRFGIEAFRPVFASFEDMYGKDLFDRLRPDWENAQSAYVESACADNVTLVSETGGRVSGFVVMKPDVFDGIGAIELLAVDPQLDNRGVGTALNQSALDWLHKAGMAYTVVSTGNDPSHAAARRSYEKVGFRPTQVQWNLMVASDVWRP